MDEKGEYSAGLTDCPSPEDGVVMWTANIVHSYVGFDGVPNIWSGRIQCFGQTEQAADELRDRVLLGLALVEMDEQAGRAAEICSGGGA